jgi:uncharacterized protein (TIGR03663 family)
MQDTAHERTSFLDSPVLGTRITWWMLCYALILGFIVFTRFWHLAARAYCHDESIHAWESWKLLTGQGYVHNPVYHGPFLYHFTALIFMLFGDNDFTARVPTVLLGIAITCMPLLMERWLGKRGILMATLLMAISPVLMHRSRFIRHDQGAILFNLILFIAIARYLDKRDGKYLYWAAAAISLSLCGKETTFITFFIFGTFLAGLLVYQWLRDRSQRLLDMPVFDLMVVIGTLIMPLASPFAIRMLGHDPVDYSQQGIYFSAAVFLVVLGASAAIGLWWNAKRWLVCAGIFYAVFVPFFTSMFTNGQGFATGMVGQLGYWLSQQEVARGGQPWFYYLVVMPMYEFLPMLVGLGATIYYFIRGDAREEQERLESGHVRVPFVALLIYWTLLAFAAYSWAGEKMPWLCLHLVTPLTLLAGWGLGKLISADWRTIRSQHGLWLLAAVPTLLYTVWKLVRSKPFVDTTTAGLSATMGWVTTLLVALILLAAIYVITKRLRGTEFWRMAALGVLVVLMVLTVRFAWMATFINGDMATEFLVYAQGSPDVALISHELETMSRRLTGGLHMKVAYDDKSSWPMVWYLRNFDNAQFYGQKPSGPFDAEVVLVGVSNEAGVKPMLGNRYYRRQYRLIWWPNQDWYMNWTAKSLWADLQDPVARKKMWDVIFYRKHAASVTDWPYVEKVAMYIRRDVVQQLWDYGPESLTVSASLPGDEYVERWQERTAVASWGMAGAGDGQFTSPKGVGVSSQGEIYVADTFNHRIQVFDADGGFLRQWGSEGNQPGQFKEPWDVAVSPEGEVYVTDTWNHRVQVFDSQGVFLRMWGTFGEVAEPMGPGDILYGPRDLVFDAEGNVYLSDTGNKRVIKYGPDDRMISAIGMMGDAPGQFQEPVGLAISADGTLYVADTWNRRIQAFDTQLNYLREWPVMAWDGMSVANKPYLAVDAAGTVYASDPEGFRLLAFDSQGKLLNVWGQYGADLSSFNLPTGLAIDSQGRLLVVDSENQRVVLFDGR